jgi:hypothetical protein
MMARESRSANSGRPGGQRFPASFAVPNPFSHATSRQVQIKRAKVKSSGTKPAFTGLFRDKN